MRTVGDEAIDVTAVRALAHPLRLRLLDLLRYDGPATATLLARRVGESTGATSYHLRQLGRHGFIEDAARGRGRERWWRYRERRLTLSGYDGPSERELLAELLAHEAHSLDRFLVQRSEESEWDGAAFFMSRALRLTPRELEELRRGIDELVAALRPPDDQGPSEAKPVRILTFGYPLPLEEK